MYLILWAIPIFWVTMFIEWRLSQDHDVKGYELKDSATSLSMGMGKRRIGGELAWRSCRSPPQWGHG